MRRNTVAKSNQLLILGRGVDEHERGNVTHYELSAASSCRAAAVARYYRNNSALFKAQGARIVVSGGYAGIAGDQSPPPMDCREATLIGNQMMSWGIPSKVIELERDSISTTDNFAKVLEYGFFGGQDFTDENPLLTVGSRQHAIRRGIPLARAAFGITEQYGALCLPAERENFRTRAQEVLLGAMTMRAIEQVNPEPWNAEDMERVGARLEAVVKGTPEADGMAPWRVGARVGEIAAGTVEYLPHLRQGVSVQYLAV